MRSRFVVGSMGASVVLAVTAAGAGFQSGPERGVKPGGPVKPAVDSPVASPAMTRPRPAMARPVAPSLPAPAPVATTSGPAPAPAPAPSSSPAATGVAAAPPAAFTIDRYLPARPRQAGRFGFAYADSATHSVARRWNDVLLEAIRGDFARPTIHARNLYHLSAAMWDAWAAFDPEADGVFCHEKHVAEDVQAARESAISHAMNRLMRHRFASSPGVDETTALCDALMIELGFDPAYDGTDGDDPASLGNRIGQIIIDMGLTDGSNEAGDYGNLVYQPVNLPLIPDLPGNPAMNHPNRWQPLALQFFIDQSGNPIPYGYPPFLSPEWGDVTPFAMDAADAVTRQRDGKTWTVWHDPGPPPLLGGDGDADFRDGFAMVATWSAHLDPADGVMIDISPASLGNTPLPEVAQWREYYRYIEGGDWGAGYDLNPVTGLPYEPQSVPRGDYARILAEFWADGPDSETPPGHWFSILNYVTDHPLMVRRLGGEGPELDPLEWDVKTYLAMGGAMHDVAVSVWSVKGWYDYVRPVSALRYMADRGQSSDPKQPSFHPEGLPLVPGLIEVVTEESAGPGQRHEHLAGKDGVNLGKIAVYGWRGPDFIDDPAVDLAGVGWILAENWWPYQRPSFVSPPFAGYVSGHSAYSRAAARVMEFLSGSPYFPGGLGEFVCPQNEFLVFEEGPSVDVVLQWARYMDASDQSSLSRIWGGIHPPADDLPARHMGEQVAPEAWLQARRHYAGLVTCPGDLDGDGRTDFSDLLAMLAAWGQCGEGCRADLDFDGTVGPADLMDLMADFGSDCG